MSRHQLGREDLVPGHFGEYLTVDGLADDKVCIGDRFPIGTAEFEVTQPRVTCYRVGMRLGRPDVPSLLDARPSITQDFYMGRQAVTSAAADALDRAHRQAAPGQPPGGVSGA